MHKLLGGAALALALAAGTPEAQFGGLGRIAKGIGLSQVTVPKALQPDAPITTNLGDARWGDPSKDGFEPPLPKRPLTGLQRAGDGFVLQPGYWEIHDLSYCLHAGTYGPGGKGDGYLYAPPRGSQEDTVEAIVRSSVRHPEIRQHDVQVLLWAIVARAKIQDLPADERATATRLLTPAQLARLNKSAFEMVNEVAGDRLPEPLRRIAQAEAQLRSMLVMPNTSYGDLERVAVLSGAHVPGVGSQQVPSGRWSLHPDGYWIRYLPVRHTDTVVDIWVPPGSAAAGKVYDPATHIAVPGDTGRQRLIQSAREYS